MMKKTVLHQIKTRGHVLDGMSYVIECADGSLIAVDGGMPYGDAKILLDFLKKLTGSEKPVIDAWFFTHNHLDHTGAFFEMAENYADQLTVGKLVYRFLSEEFYANCEPPCAPELKRFIEDQKRFPGLEVVTPSAGDVYTYGDTKIEILYTAADLPVIDGGKGNVVNDTSLVFRVHAAGQTVLFLGDVEEAGDRVMIARYGKALKSDVVQLAHHGESSSTAEFYSYVDPDIVLWPMGEDSVKDRLYSLIVLYEANRSLLCGLHVKDTFIAGFGTCSLVLPIRPSVAPFFPGNAEELKNCTPTEGLKYCPGVTSVSLSDPVWDKAGVQRVDFTKGKTCVYALARLFWNENGIGVKAVVSGMGCQAPSDPNSFRSDNCCNVRLHFCELRLSGFEKNRWEDEHFNAFRDLRLYPEKKNVVPGGAFNNRPESFSSEGRPLPDGFEVCTFIPFRGERKKGDVVGVHIEVSFNTEPGAKREAMLTLARGFFSETYRATPYGLVWFRLE